MRGSHPGSFEAAHALRDGRLPPPPQDTGERYDLIVVGAGISGLAAAHFYRAQRGAAAAFSFSTTTMISAVMPSATNSIWTSVCTS